MKQQSELVGGGLGARRAVGGEMQLVRLDQVFGLSSRAVELLVKRLGQARQIGDDEAAVGPLWPGLDASDDAAFDVPAFGGITELAIAADLLRLAGEATQGGVFGERTDLPQQHRVDGQPEDVADALALAPRHGLRSAVMAVAADNDLDRRPAGADMADDMAQHERHLGPARRLARAQNDRDRLAARRLVNVDRQKAAAVVVRIEQRELLPAVHPV